MSEYIPQIVQSASPCGYFTGNSTTNYYSFWNAGTILPHPHMLPYEEMGMLMSSPQMFGVIFLCA